MTSDQRVIHGRYRLLHTLGQGGEGTVWLAEDVLLGRMVALKELGKWYAYDDSTERRTRAVQEARILARLNHPAIVRIHDVHPRVAMRILRHSKIAVTMEIGIAEAPSDATRDALRKLTDWLA